MPVIKRATAPRCWTSAREVEIAIEALRALRLVSVVSEADARVMKFRHTLVNAFPVLDTEGRAVLAELLLRGPQTTAELRARAERLAPIPDLAGVESLLSTLALTEYGALTRKLARQPGKKEARWAQLLSGEPAPPPTCRLFPLQPRSLTRPFAQTGQAL